MDLIAEKIAPHIKERLVNQFSDQAVSELSVLDIENIEEEIQKIGQVNHAPLELILCTGDRVNNLKNESQVLEFVRDCARLLCTGGKLFLSYKNLFTSIGEEQRFIPVPLSDDHLLTTVQEFLPNHVIISELLYEKSPSGAWTQKVRSYYKLRISEGLIIDAFVSAGLEIHLFTNEKGVVSVLGVKI